MKGFPGLFILLSLQAFAQPAFRVVPLGVLGGLDESNLSAYMVAPAGTKQYVCFDAGTLQAGIDKAITKKTFNANAATVLRQYIKAYFISHPHLDHVGGLIINAPADTNKTVYGLPATINGIVESFFNGMAWTNFGDTGKGFLIRRYHMQAMDTAVPMQVAGTELSITAFQLSHIHPYLSSAFLLEHTGQYVLYLGDTGADEIEKTNSLQALWQHIAPLVQSKKLKGIFIEVSYANSQPTDKLFGHLTPSLLMKELDILSAYTGKKVLAGLNIVVTHMKPPAENFPIIKKELQAQNKLGLRLIFPEQGRAFTL